MRDIHLSYDDFWELRISLGYVDRTVVFYLEFEDSYNIWMDVQGTRVSTGASGDDLTDFEATKKSKCNIQQSIRQEIVWTHDFSDNSDWIFGTSNSLFVLNPTTGRVFIFDGTKLSFDKDLSISGNTMRMIIWIGLEAPCPEFDDAGKVRTPYGSPLFDEETGTGWITKEDFQEAGGFKPQYFLGAQEVTHWIYMENNVRQYMAVVHEYTSIEEIKAKARHSTDGNTTETKQNFLEPINLRDSYNERIEVYSVTDTEHTAPNSVPSRAVFYGYVTNEI